MISMLYCGDVKNIAPHCGMPNIFGMYTKGVQNVKMVSVSLCVHVPVCICVCVVCQILN